MFIRFGGRSEFLPPYLCLCEVSMNGENLNNLKTVNHQFYKKLTIVGIPMVIQQVIAVTLNLADTIMVGKVGENALAAVGAANQIYFIFGVVLFGVFSGAAVHAVQYWGIRDVASLRKIIGIDYTVCVALAIPAMLFVYFAAPFLIGLFADEPEVIELGTKYLHIACFTYIFAGLGNSGCQGADDYQRRRNSAEYPV